MAVSVYIGIVKLNNNLTLTLTLTLCCFWAAVVILKKKKTFCEFLWHFLNLTSQWHLRPNNKVNDIVKLFNTKLVVTGLQVKDVLLANSYILTKNQKRKKNTAMCSKQHIRVSDVLLGTRGGKSQISFWEAEGVVTFFLAHKFTFVTETNVRKFRIYYNRHIIAKFWSFCQL